MQEKQSMHHSQDTSCCIGVQMGDNVYGPTTHSVLKTKAQHDSAELVIGMQQCRFINAYRHRLPQLTQGQCHFQSLEVHTQH